MERALKEFFFHNHHMQLLGIAVNDPPPLICFLSVALLLIASRGSGWLPLRAASKCLASICFVWQALANAPHAPTPIYALCIVVGLAWGALGDVFLLSSKKALFLCGLGSFLVGHLAYIYAFVALAPDSLDMSWVVACAVVMAVQAGLVVLWLRGSVSADMWPPVAAYILVISLMVCAAGGLYGGRAEQKQFNIFIGACLFYISDLCVARNTFVSKSFVNSLIGLPLYYLAQVIIASNFL